MLTIVCMNPSIDRTLTVANWIHGGTNRALHTRSDPGGKGVNVARIAQCHGLNVHLTGFWGTDNQAPFAQALTCPAIDWTPLLLSGSTRVNWKLYDASSAITTEVNEPGLSVTSSQLDALTTHVCTLAPHSEGIVCTGSLPPGCPEDFYAALIRQIRRVAPTCRCIVDAAGAPLRYALQEAPDWIKPNRDELSTLYGRPLSTLAEVAHAAHACIRQGVSLVIATLGAQGALCVTREATLYAPALTVPVRSTVGAGDTLLAGMLCAHFQKSSLYDAFAQGMAMSAASVMMCGTEPVTPAQWTPLCTQVQIQKIG